MNARLIALGMTLAATAAVGANQPVSIKASPAVSFAPADLIIRTSVDPDADNRLMEVVAESGDFYRSSSIQLEGDRAPKTTQFYFKSLPPGEYEISATVITSDGQRRAAARTQVKVIGNDGE